MSAVPDAFRRRIRDPRILAAAERAPRELFVPERLRAEAWDDRPLPIGGGQTISQPSLVLRMCAALELRDDERVLDVGTGSGWHAALLSGLAAHVWSIERDPELAAQAEANLRAAGIENVTVLVGDGRLGHEPAAPYDAVNVAAATDDVPAPLLDQLARGGRLIAPVGRRWGQRLVLVRRADDGALTTEELDPVRFVPLVPGVAAPGDPS